MSVLTKESDNVSQSTPLEGASDGILGGYDGRVVKTVLTLYWAQDRERLQVPIPLLAAILPSFSSSLSPPPPPPPPFSLVSGWWAQCLSIQFIGHETQNLNHSPVSFKLRHVKDPQKAAENANQQKQ